MHFSDMFRHHAILCGGIPGMNGEGYGWDDYKEKGLPAMVVSRALRWSKAKARIKLVRAALATGRA